MATASPSRPAHVPIGNVLERAATAFANIWTHLVSPCYASKDSQLADALSWLVDTMDRVAVPPQAAGLKADFSAGLFAAFRQIANTVPIRQWIAFEYKKLDGPIVVLHGVAGCLHPASGHELLFFRMDGRFIFECVNLDVLVQSIISLSAPERVIEARLHFLLPSVSVYNRFAHCQLIEAQRSEYFSFEVLRNVLSTPDGAGPQTVELLATESNSKMDYLVRIAGQEHVIVEVAVTRRSSPQRENKQDPRQKAFDCKIRQAVRKMEWATAEYEKSVSKGVKHPSPVKKFAAPPAKPESSRKAKRAPTALAEPTESDQPAASPATPDLPTVEANSSTAASAAPASLSPSKPCRVESVETELVVAVGDVPIDFAVAHLWSLVDEAAPVPSEAHHPRCLRFYTALAHEDFFEQGAMIKLLSPKQ